jgi:hypothetical protein
MSVQSRNHVQTSGNGAATLVSIHGFGCGRSIRHCPHMSGPTESSRAIDAFLAQTLR